MWNDWVETFVFASFDDFTFGLTKVGTEDDIGSLGDEEFGGWYNVK